MAGCEQPDESAREPAPKPNSGFPYVLYFDPVGVDEAVRFFASGRELGVVKGYGAVRLGDRTVGEYEPTGGKIVDLTSELEPGPKVTAQVPSACGWQDAQVTERLRAPPVYGTDGKLQRPGAVRVFIQRPPRTWVMIDNRKAPAATFTLGKLQWEIPADSPKLILLTQPACEFEMKIGGNVLARPGVTADIPHLIDPTGRRCYEYSTVRYGVPEFGGERPRETSTRLSARAVHSLPGPVDHWFEAAPTSVKAFGGHTGATRTQLIEVSCR